MGFIYKIEVDNELYIGSTKKNLSYRQASHNCKLNNLPNKDSNIYLYRFCREKKVKKIICELLQTVDDTKLKILEQEYINKLKPSLNTIRVCITEEQRIEKKKEHTNKNNKIKSKCPICGKEMLKNNIYRHIRNIHNI